MRRVALLRSLVIGGMAIALSSCTGYVPHLRVIRANYNVSRGEYQLAIVDYLRAQESPTYERWLSYNLGNVYHFLGESGAANQRWEVARASDVSDLQFGASFNQGVWHYEQGQYMQALRQFRFALAIEPTSRAAKTNFELTLEKLAAGSELGGTSEGGTAAGAAAASPSDSGATRMLDYMQRTEDQRWRARSEQSPPIEERDW
jgi:tetratricopeptide (TPR) repeat protein